MEKILDVIKQSDAFIDFTDIVKSNRDLKKKDEIDKIYDEKKRMGVKKYSSYEDALMSLATVQETEDGLEITVKCKIGKVEDKKLSGYALYSVIASVGNNMVGIEGRCVAKLRPDQEEDYETILEEDIDELLLLNNNIRRRK